MTQLRLAFGYTFEELRKVLEPMAATGMEALASTGVRRSAGRAVRQAAAFVQLL
ncbi:glutamate synthase central domain-containing protein [Paenibacillus sp. JTLBN-2024]